MTQTPLNHFATLATYHLFPFHLWIRPEKKKSQLRPCVTHMSLVLPESSRYVVFKGTISIVLSISSYIQYPHQAHKVVIRSYVTIIKMFQLKTKITQWVAHIKTFKDYFFSSSKGPVLVRKTTHYSHYRGQALWLYWGKKSQSYDIDFGNHNRNDKIKAEGLKPCCIVN